MSPAGLRPSAASQALGLFALRAQSQGGAATPRGLMPRRFTEWVNVRFAPEDVAELDRRAALVGLRRGAFLRRSALEIDLRGRLEGELVRRLSQLVLTLEERPDQADAARDDLRTLLRELL